MIESGMSFGRLTVIGRDYDEEKKHVTKRFYKCVCSCKDKPIVTVDEFSLLHGVKKSCGCLRGNNLIGKTFGYLEVIDEDNSFVRTSGMHKKFLCKCHRCNNEELVSVRGSDLRTGNKIDCGCMTKSNIGLSNTKDLTGEIIGHLHVFGRDVNTKPKSGQHANWICFCDICKTTSIISSNMLLSYGKDRCSNCIGIPIGESKIMDILNENNMKYIHDENYMDCKYPETNARLYFDFIVNPDDETYIVEFDGVQHFKEIPYWERSMSLAERQKRDVYKNDWCRENDIPLIRIPYTHLNKLSFNDLLPEASDFLVS